MIFFPSWQKAILCRAIIMLQRFSVVPVPHTEPGLRPVCRKTAQCRQMCPVGVRLFLVAGFKINTTIQTVLCQPCSLCSTFICNIQPHTEYSTKVWLHHLLKGKKWRKSTKPTSQWDACSRVVLSFGFSVLGKEATFLSCEVQSQLQFLREKFVFYSQKRRFYWHVSWHIPSQEKETCIMGS